MANSKITIIFNSIPNVDDVLNFMDSSQALSFDEIFKNQRVAAKQTTIPQIGLARYEMTYSDAEDISNISVSYNDGIQRNVPLGAVLSIDNNDGTITAIVNSNYPPAIMQNGVQIVWPGGSFNWVSGTYSTFISENFRSAFNIDYNISNLFTVTTQNGPAVSGLGSVIIEANYLGAVFEAGTTTADVTFIIENVVADPFLLLNSSISASDINQCERFKLTLETSKLADTILINNQVVTTNNINNPYVVELFRGTIYNVTLRNTSSGQNEDIRYLNGGIPFRYPRLIPANFNIDVQNTLAGANLSITPNFPTSSINIPLQYSLDNTTWNTTGTFTGLTSGDLTVYIRDSEAPGAINLGCLLEIPVTIDEQGYRKPYVYLSKANSINYSMFQNVNNCDVFRNDENSLSFQSLSKIKYCDNILLAKCDSPKTQIHSNYRDVTAVLRNDLNDNVISLPVDKKSNNLNRFQSMDAMIFSYQPGVSAIYFEDGNTYDEFGVINGSYSLLGNLPDMAKIGNIIEIQGVDTFEIVDEIFDFEKNKKAIIINYSSTSTLPEPIIVSSLYDLLKFEVYEFEMNCLFLQSGLYDIVITNSNGDSNDVIFISENIYIENNHSDTLHILYFGKNNRDIFYKYGIKNMMRVRYENLIMKIIDDIETITTDDNTGVVKSTIKDGNTFIFDELPRDFAFKLILALSMEYVFINGTGYAKGGEITYEVTDNTNMYKITADMIKTNVAYTSIGKQEEFVDIDTGIPISFPRILTDGTNFIKA